MVRITRTQAIATVALVFVACFWGTSYAVVKDTLDRVGPVTIMMLRFDLATVVLALVYARRLRRIRRVDVQRGALIGVFLFLGLLLLAYGITYTSASQQAFLIGSYVLLVPFLAWVVNGRSVDGYDVFGAGAATVGLALITLGDDLGINRGDVLSVLSAVMVACHMVAVDRYSRDSDPVLLTIVQFATAGAMFSVVAPLLEGVDLSWVTSAPGEIAYITLVTTVFAFLGQNVAQRYLSATTVSLILTLEAAAGALFAVAYLGEQIQPRMLLGCLVLFAAIVTQETKPGRSRLRARRTAA